MAIEGKWFFELIAADLVLLYRVKRSLYSGKTAYQEVEILETETMGRSLILDGKTQSTTVDEHIYHEALVHPAMLLHPNPRTVFIGGGGEGATLREVLAHKSVERVTMVDLDDEVVALARRYIPEHSSGAFDDPKARLVHQDARGFLAESADAYDVILLDLVDPLEEGTAYTLYTREFYETALGKLSPGGVLVTQSGPGSLLNHQECFTAIVNTLTGLFPRVAPYSVYVPAFVTPWTFAMAFNGPDPGEWQPDTVDRLVQERLATPLRFYDGNHAPAHVFTAYLPEGGHRPRDACSHRR